MKRKNKQEPSDFNKYFQHLRKTKDTDQSRQKIPLQMIADKTGISCPYLSSMSKNNYAIPSDEKLKLLAVFFQVDVDEFYLKLGVLPEDEYKAVLKVRKKTTKEDFMKLVQEMV